MPAKSPARLPRPTVARRVDRTPPPTPTPSPENLQRVPRQTGTRTAGAPSLPTILRRSFAPAAHTGHPQGRVFYAVYALVTLPAVLALHTALWVLATPGRLVLVTLALLVLSHGGALTPVGH